MLKQNKATAAELKARFRGNEAVCARVIGLFHLISNKIRFRILCVLSEGDFCVNDILGIIELGKVSNVSQQLKLLLLAGVVEKRRDKKQFIYRLKDTRVRAMIRHLQAQYMEDNA